MFVETNKAYFEKNGYLVLNECLSPSELKYYDKIYDDFIKSKFDTKGLRSDLSGEKSGKRELITQIMLPSKIFPQLLNEPIHTFGLKIAQFLLGDDIVLDFDMLINKAPNTNKETPWHQDAAYWIDMPDERALSIWFAIDKATLNSGCMWYTPCLLYTSPSPRDRG